MSDTLETLSRKKEAAAELNAVVLTMKAMAAANISQFEMAVESLKDYYHTISLGVSAWFSQDNIKEVPFQFSALEKDKKICAIVFGTDQGLVGKFNDILAEYVVSTLDILPGEKEIWAIGDRIYSRLSDSGLTTKKLFPVPNSVTAITGLVDNILRNAEESREKSEMEEFYIFHNAPISGAGYEPAQQRLLPLDVSWEKELALPVWSTNNLPGIAGDKNATLAALIREYLFVSLFKSCAESLAGENASRLRAMQRAEKNIAEMLDGLTQNYNRLRQSSIDEELFDVISGFEALKNKK